MKKSDILFCLVFFAIVIICAIYDHNSNYTPQEFEYKKHDYIYFPGKGIIHSPDCHKCTLTFEMI